MRNSETKTWIAIAYFSLVSIMLSIGLFPPSITALANPHLSNTQVKPAIFSLTGTIHKVAIEGTCYQLTTENGKNYELMGKFPKRDGTKIQVIGTVATDIATICQVGQPFQVKSARIIK